MRRGLIFTMLAMLIALGMALLPGCTVNYFALDVDQDGGSKIDFDMSGAQISTRKEQDAKNVMPDASLDLSSVKEMLSGAIPALPDIGSGDDGGDSGGDSGEVVTPDDEGDEGVVEPDDTDSLTFKYHGLSNPDKPTYYTYKGRLKVGDKFSIECGDVLKVGVAKVRGNGSIGFDWSDGTIIKNAEMESRGVALLIPSSYAGKQPSDCWLKL